MADGDSVYSLIAGTRSDELSVRLMKGREALSSSIPFTSR